MTRMIAGLRALASKVWHTPTTHPGYFLTGNTILGVVGSLVLIGMGNGWQWSGALLLFIAGVGLGAGLEKRFPTQSK